MKTVVIRDVETGLLRGLEKTDNMCAQLSPSSLLFRSDMLFCLSHTIIVLNMTPAESVFLDCGSVNDVDEILL